jgi:phospholipid transport system substrate-binding protein
MGKTLAAWLMLAAAAAPASAPREVVQSAVTRVLGVLQDTATGVGDPQRAVAERRRLELHRIARELFDFDDMARRTLSQHWSARSPEERDEFVSLFADLLARSYVGRIEVYAAERITYPAELVDGAYAVVKSRVALRRHGEIALDYRLHRREGRWRVYDVVVEGVSFVSNYRSEFNRIIQASSYAALVDRMRQKRITVSTPDRL